MHLDWFRCTQPYLECCTPTKAVNVFLLSCIFTGAQKNNPYVLLGHGTSTSLLLHALCSEKMLPPWAWVRDVARKLPDLVWPPDYPLLVFQMDTDETEGGSSRQCASLRKGKSQEATEMNCWMVSILPFPSSCSTISGFRVPESHGICHFVWAVQF